MKLIRQDTSFTITDLKRIDKYPYVRYTRDDDTAHGPIKLEKRKFPQLQPY